MRERERCGREQISKGRLCRNHCLKKNSRVETTEAETKPKTCRERDTHKKAERKATVWPKVINTACFPGDKLFFQRTLQMKSWEINFLRRRCIAFSNPPAFNCSNYPKWRCHLWQPHICIAQSSLRMAK